ncbi:MAG: hypothetical protein Q4F65_03075 [Propionibacteriaceae bacterium]|nr:hypothetical protein [Propionibacteriaceae bacterium]
MTHDQHRALEADPVAPATADEDEEEGGAASMLINIGLFAFMVVFAVGCGLLGWFG